ncbi:MAG: DNA/RNA non-specific endonuclease [Phycisphaerae bacterium]|nr:DNA/RNA non-specific endonuclease [Phycisphaerae bacterium]
MVLKQKNFLVLTVLFVGALSLLSQLASSNSASRPVSQGPHAYAGLPKTDKPLTILHNIGYVAGYCETLKNPAWVVYCVAAAKKPVTHKRPPRFKVDIRTKAKVRHEDYSRSGYDRGHMAPNYAIDTRYGREAQLETFLMSNVCPQKPNVNQGVWRELEMLIAKDYTNRYGEVWVIIGPIFDQGKKTIGDGVSVPCRFFMILATETKDGVRVLAFIIPQSAPQKANPERYLTSVNEIEKLTGLDVLHELPDELEEEIESGKAAKLWGVPNQLPVDEGDKAQSQAASSGDFDSSPAEQTAPPSRCFTHRRASLLLTATARAFAVRTHLSASSYCHIKQRVTRTTSRKPCGAWLEPVITGTGKTVYLADITPHDPTAFSGLLHPFSKCSVCL